MPDVGATRRLALPPRQDGEWIGFFTVGNLRKVPLRGGVASSVTEARNPYGGTWAEDGTIYFLDAEGSELVAVREDGTGRSDATLHGSFFDPLTRFSVVAREAVPAPRDGVRALLVYGGDRRQRRNAGSVLPWKDIHSYDWDPEVAD